jgi:phosphatidate phosphatase APP1
MALWLGCAKTVENATTNRIVDSKGYMKIHNKADRPTSSMWLRLVRLCSEI